MNSTIDRDRRSGDPRSTKRRRRLIGLMAVGVTAAATATGCAVTRGGDTTVPPGTHTMEIYTVVDSISTVVPPTDRPGAIGRFLGMCDADTYYIEVDGTGLCVVLAGSLGTVQATGTGRGVQLSAAEAARTRDIVRIGDRGGTEPTTRVVLGYDGGWVAVVDVADLSSGGPVNGSAIG